MSDCRIFLGDLAHNFAHKGPFTMPINIGYLAGYLDKLYGQSLEVRLFKFPQDLLNAVEQDPPHILGLSNYTWNLELNRQIIAWVKARSPNTVTVCGGPDYPLVPAEAERYLKARPGLDFFVRWQGESGLARLVERFVATGSPRQMKREPLPNCDFLDPKSGSLVACPVYEPVQDLAEIPSPYLEGIMDPFFQDGMMALIETNRGCPYTCTYCAWGASAQRKVLAFPLERVLAELDYIATQPHKSDVLMIGDANFGIMARDVEIARYLRRIRERHGYPSNISIAWAKATPGRIKKMAALLKDMTSITASFQTLEPKVQANIKRKNLSYEQFREIQDYFYQQGVPSHSELILPLPGETKQSHLDALRKLFATNLSHIACYNLRMINGSELSTGDSRKKWGFKTKCRLVDGGFGRYGEVLAVEHEEMVVATADMTMQEVLYFRPIHFYIFFLWNYGYYALLLQLLKTWGLNPLDLIISLVERDKEPPPAVERILNDFAREAREEWFPDREALVSHYSKPHVFKELAAGSFGKLNFKYMFRFLLECRADFDRYLRGTTLALLERSGRSGHHFQAELEEVMHYLAEAFVDFSRWEQELEREKTVEFSYDLLAWRNDDCSQPLHNYPRPGLRLRFSLDEFQYQTLNNRLASYRQNDLNQSLRKMVEYMNHRHLLYQVDYA